MPKQYKSSPPMTIDANKKYTATFKTSRGEIVCELFAQDKPQTVNNFVFLAKDGFYDGTTFHRVISDFMIQGGCPQGTGYGGPGYKFADEIAGKTNKHKPGSLSMANAGPNSNGSQFFITHKNSSTGYLDPKHTVFGQVTKGQDVVESVKPGDKLETLTITEA